MKNSTQTKIGNNNTNNSTLILRNKLRCHFRLRKNYYIVSGIVLAILLTMYCILGIFPFGTKTIVTNDTMQQIVPFLGLIIDTIEGKSTLIFSNYIAGGANIVGYISYFIFSPFYLIVLPFGKANILRALDIAFLLQFVCISVVFLWFIRKYFKLNDLCQIILTLLYTFSPYILLDFSWFSWLFLYTLLPLVIHYFLKMIKTKKILGFTLCVTAMIYNCYGVGLMGQILIFIIGTIFIFTMIKDKPKQKTCMINMCIAYGLAICFTLPFLAINAMQLFDSSRMSGSLQIFTKGLFENLNISINYIILDVISLIFGITYLIRCDKKKGFNQFLIATLLLNAIPMLIDGVYLILSMGSYFGFSMRMSYILSFFMVITLACFLKDYCRKHSEVSATKKEKIYLFLELALVLILILLLLFVIYPALKNLSSWSLLNDNTNLYLAIFSIFSIFPIILFFTILHISKETNRARVSKKSFLVALLILTITQNFTDSIFMMGIKNNAYDDLLFVVEQSETLDINYSSRMKDAQDSVICNLHLISDFSQFSGFASQINGNFLNTTRALGYYTAGAFDSQVTENATYTYGGTILSDSFLAMDYVLYKEEVDFPWLQPISSKVFSEKDKLYLYKNTLSLNNAILVDKNKKLDLSGNLLECTNSLFNYLGGEGEIMRAVSLSEIANGTVSDICSLSQENGEAKVTFSSTPYSKVMYISGKPDELKTVNITNDFHKGLYLFDDTFVTVDYFEQNTGGTLTINDYKPQELERIIIYELNYDMLVELITNIQSQEIDFTYTASGFEAKANASEQKMVVTNVNIDGYKAMINGKEISLNECNFVELNLIDGENNIIVTYHFPYTKTLIISLALSIVGLVTLLLIRKYLHKLPKFGSLIYYGGMALFIAFLVAIYFIPSVIFVGRICLLKF